MEQQKKGTVQLLSRKQEVQIVTTQIEEHPALHK
jgi:hypothetical protein